FFRWNLSLAAVIPAATVEVASFNGNRIPDLGIAGASESTVALHLDPMISKHYPEVFVDVQGLYTALAVADLDGDGLPDLAGADRNAGLARAALLDASFRVRSEIAVEVGLSPEKVAVVDLDGDALPDLVLPCSGSG